MKRIIFIPTWKCNLSCDYCYYRVSRAEYPSAYQVSIYGHERQVGPELAWQDWLQHLGRLAPFHLEITGGEPLMYRDLGKIVDSLPGGCKWSITSNTLLTEAVMKMPSNGCICWTASYHYGNDDRFAGNLDLLRKVGIQPCVTLVITPQNYDLALQKINWLSGMEYRLNVHPVQDITVPWKGHDDIWDKVQQMQGANIVREIPKDWRREGPASCSGGKDYICIHPDGQVLRCLSSSMSSGNIGHIKDFEPYKENRPCAGGCVFPCDKATRNGR
jgi:hypothetical protein